MFWSKRSVIEAQVAITTREVEAPVAITVEPKLSDVGFLEYKEVAERIGLTNQPAFLEERLSRFLLEENIRIYQKKRVYEYLNSKFPTGWEWRGVREEDCEYLKGWTSHAGELSIRFGDRIYGDRIPFPVLLTIEKIKTAFPKEVFFYINHATVHGDPFLMVSNRDIASFIVERWDEPSFR
mgnify:CR=1 FL=1